MDCLKVLEDAASSGRKRNPYLDLVERFKDQSMPHLVVVREGEEVFTLEGCNLPELDKHFSEAVGAFLRDVEAAKQEEEAHGGL